MATRAHPPGGRQRTGLCLSVVLALLAPPASAATRTSSSALSARGELTSIVLDYELPGHANTKGRGHVGAVGRATVLWRPADEFVLEGGVLGRLPFALDLEEEAGALPILSLTVHLAEDLVLLRFGSLDLRHGYHPAVVDEARYAFGRNYAETYVRSLARGVVRDVGKDPFMPAEHGAQAIFETSWLRAEAFVDWQLLETAAHREKFAVGVLARATSELADLALQLRLLHYGGELFTKTDPIRDMQLDPVRQPLTLAASTTLTPLGKGPTRVEVPLAFIAGRLAQGPGEAPSWHRGFEGGVEGDVFDLLRLGWRLWLPIRRDAGFLSEDGDPIYSGRRSHRAIFGLHGRYGPAELTGHLDLVFAEGASKVEYETVTTLSVAVEELLWPRR